jgi:anti-anti-sigma factor
MMMMSQQPANATLYQTRQSTAAQGQSAFVLDVQVDSFDHRYVEQFKEAITQQAQLHGQTPLLLNLEQVNFMDSAGLGIVLYAHRVCKQHQKPFAVVGLNGYVHKLFELSGVGRAIALHTNEQAYFEGPTA